MHSEETLMIEYLSKISELILQMRYDPQQIAAANVNQASNVSQNNQASNNIVEDQQQLNHNNSLNNTNSPQSGNNALSNTQKFGFILPKQQYKIENIITEKWNSSYTALTIEFFLKKKSDGSNQCIEQWQFCYEKEFAHPQNSSNNDLKNQQGNKKNKKQSTDMKLTILSRSIASLLVNTPLWQMYISNRQLKNAFILDYKISFSKNKPIQNSTAVQLNQLSLTSGQLIVNCFFLKDLDKILSNSIEAQNKNNSCLHDVYSSSNCNNNCRNSNISNNANSISTTHSQNYENKSNSNSYEPNNFRKKQRERFLSDNLDVQELITGQINQNDQISSSTRNASDKVQSKHQITKNNKNMTFRFAFSDNEPLSDEEKKIIKHHLRQSSVVSVYSRKDDITIVSTPEEIAMKMQDDQVSEMNGLEIEMVLEEEKQDSRFSNDLYSNNNKNKNKKSEIFNNNKSNNQTKRKSNNNLYLGLDDNYNVNQVIPSKKEKEELAAQIIIDDDFDFQIIDDENDKSIDLALKKLSELINQHKVQMRQQTATQSAFELYQSLTQYVENY